MMKYQPGQRVHLPPIDKMHIPARHGIIEQVKTLPNGFQRIWVDFDYDTGLGLREVHPAHLTLIESE